MTVELCVLPSIHSFTTEKLKRNLINLRPFTLKFDQHHYKKNETSGTSRVTEKSNQNGSVGRCWSLLD